MIENILKLLDRVDGDVKIAAESILDGPKKIALYVLEIGLLHLKAKKRATRRRSLRSEAKPRFKTGRTTGNIELTKQAKVRLFKMTQELFGDDGWQIGALNLGSFTKEALLAEAASERKSAKGHIQNALFYEALAEPLQPGQLVKDYWKPETATKIKGDIWKSTEGQRPELV